MYDSPEQPEQSSIDLKVDEVEGTVETVVPDVTVTPPVSTNPELPTCPGCKQQKSIQLLEGWTNVYYCDGVECMELDCFIWNKEHPDSYQPISDSQLSYRSDELEREKARTTAITQAKEPQQPSGQLSLYHGQQSGQSGYVRGYSHQSYGQSISYQQQKGPRVGGDGVVYCDVEDISDGRCPEQAPEVFIPRSMFDQWTHLAGQFNVEWIAYLIGEQQRRDGSYVIRSMRFPPQTSGPTTVDVPDSVQPPRGTIGAVHSHVNMPAFFSGCDDSHSNWPVEIVVNARGEFKMMVRFKLGCGRWAKVASTALRMTAPVDVRTEQKLHDAFKEGKRLERQEEKRKREKGKRSLKVKGDQVIIQPPVNGRGNGKGNGSEGHTYPQLHCLTCDHPRSVHGSGGCNEHDISGICPCRVPYGQGPKDMSMYGYLQSWDWGS